MATETRRIGIIDAGTGIRQLDADFEAMDTGQTEIFIAFSHFHWDHSQGFPFFIPACNPEMTINVLAKRGDRKVSSLREIFAVQMQQTYFPFALEDMGARFKFMVLENASQTFIPPAGSPVVVTAVRHRHPEGAYSYRDERAGRSIVLSIDIEHGREIDGNIVSLAQRADILIHDGQYSNQHLETKRGWREAACRHPSRPRA